MQHALTNNRAYPIWAVKNTQSAKYVQLFYLCLIQNTNPFLLSFARTTIIIRKKISNYKSIIKK